MQSQGCMFSVGTIPNLQQAKSRYVFSVNLVCKKELNLMLKVSETSSQSAVGFELRGTDYFLPRLIFLSRKHTSCYYCLGLTRCYPVLALTNFTAIYCLPPWSGGQVGIKFKAGAIKNCKETKITSPPNAWHNILL